MDETFAGAIYLQFMTLGHNDQFWEGPVLSSAATVELSSARETLLKSTPARPLIWPVAKTRLRLDCLPLPIPEKSTSGVLLWHRAEAKCQPWRSAKSYLFFQPRRCRLAK